MFIYLPSKLHEVKETTTDVINIIRELREPEVQKSIENIKAVANAVNDIAAIFKDPQFSKNVENISLAAANLKVSMVAVQNTAAELNRAGTLAELNLTIRSVRNLVDSLSNIQAEGGMIASVTHLVVAAKQLMEEAQKIRNDPLKKPRTVPAPAKSK